MGLLFVRSCASQGLPDKRARGWGAAPSEPFLLLRASLKSLENRRQLAVRERVSKCKRRARPDRGRETHACGGGRAGALRVFALVSVSAACSGNSLGARL